MDALEIFVNSYNSEKVYNLIPGWIFDSSKAIVSNGQRRV